MPHDRFRFEPLNATTAAATRALILDGLGDHWGAVDESLNPDLDDMLTSYAQGSTIVALGLGGHVAGTGTVVPRDGNVAEIVRMSVDSTIRRSGLGRAIVEELVTIARDWNKDAVILETTSAWTEVVAFYVSCGFEITHTADSEFGEDTWFRMRLQ